MSIDKKIKSSKPLLFILGSFVLILGTILILLWWQDVVILFRGIFGILLALGGMFVLYMVKE